MRTRFILAALLASCVLCAHAAHATTYYVRLTGSDSNTGKSKKRAFRTLAKAMSVAKNRDTVWIGAGTYSEPLIPQFNGTSTTKLLKIYGDYTGVKTDDAGTITITRSGAPCVDVSKNYIIIRDVTISGGTDGVRWSGSGGTLQNVIITGATDDALELTGGSLTTTSVTTRNASDCGVVLSGAATLSMTTGIVTGCGGQGVVLSNASASATINRSRISDQTGRGLDMTVGAAVLRNCVIYDNAAGNIRADGATSSSLTVQYCTLVGGTRCIELRGTTTTVQNTIMAHSGAGIFRISASPATSLTHTNNLYWSNTTNLSGWSLGGTDITANPAFMDAASKDFNISGASAAYNRGVNISGVTVDYLNRARPALGGYDIGAYEGQTPAPTVPYFTDFQSTVGAEWSSTTTTTNATLTTFLGRFANETQSFRVATTIGTEYTLMFDGYFVDSWDGDSDSYGPDNFMVTVGGTTLLDNTFTCQPNTAGFEYSYAGWPHLWSTNLAAGGSQRDQAMRAMVVRFTASTSETVISFAGSNLQGLSDESWGIDNVRVVARASESTYIPRFTEAGHGADWYAFPGVGSAPILSADLSASGLPDTIIGGATTINVYENDDDNWTPSSVSAAMRQACAMDLDNNGTPEVWYNRTGSAFGAFRWSTSGLVGMTTPSTITGVSGCETMAAADMNKDGYCDLVLLGSSGNHIALNNGPNASDVFTGFTMNATVLPQTATDRGDGDNCSIGDINGDGYPDIFYHYNGGRLFLSDGAGGYTSNNMGISVSTGSSSKMGSAFADYDNDGDLDLFVGRRSGTRAYLWKNMGLVFADVAGANGLQSLPNVVAATWGDYDNDGDQDLAYVTTSGTTGIARNSGSPLYTFTPVTEGFLTESRAGDITFTDYDNDGDLDIALTSETATHPALLYRNDGANASNALSVRVVGAGRNGLNTAGVGARVELWNAADTTLLQRRDIGLAQGFGGQSPLRAHFGGVNPASTYTVRVYGGAQPIITTVTPSAASTAFDNGTDPAIAVPRLLTVTEADTAPAVRVTRWREVRGDE